MSKMLGWLALLPLLGLLLAIMRQDILSRRIPNKLVLIGILTGVVLNGLLPSGAGFNSALPGGLGWFSALQGLGAGFAVFLPIYWLRAMGAGDVKLMAMVGAFLGPFDVLGVMFATFFAGGAMALIVVLWTRQIASMLLNVKLMLLGGMVKMSAGRLPLMNDLPASVGKLPYAVAITAGTFGYLIWQHFSRSF